MKNQLDEMQERELLKIEHNGCWLAFWLLAVSLFVQPILFGTENLTNVAGEWVILMVLALYLAIASARRGIWDRHLKMNGKTNLLLSALAGLVLGGYNAAIVFKRFEKPVGSVASGLISGVIAFVFCELALTMVMRYTKKKQSALEQEPKEE